MEIDRDLEKQALEGLFAAAEKAIRQSKESFSNLERIFYCEGPAPPSDLELLPRSSVVCSGPFNRNQDWMSITPWI